MSDHPLLARVRALALELPGTSERPSHGQPTFFVAGKQFAQFRHHHHGDARTVLCVRTSGPDEQETVLEAQPEVYSRPAYLASSGWVGLDIGRAEADWDQVADRIARSWELAAPRALLEAGGR